MSSPDEPPTPTRCSEIPPFAPSLSTPSCQSRPLPSFALLDNTGLRTPSRAPNTLLRQLQNVAKVVPSAPTVEKQDFLFGKYDPEKEPIKTYLRIRPPPPNQERAHSAPYINVVNDTGVVMTPPETSNAYKTRNRAPERYHFTRVFSDRATQKEFFDDIALPLVRDVLNGRNSLLFAYGVTNSGKTYTIQGTRADGGLLPRALNVVFNSVKGFQSGSKLRPVGYNDVERYETDDTMLANRGGNNATASINEKEQLVSGFDGALNALISVDHTVLSIDNKYEYAIWVSYAEIYADHIYDLLQSPVRGERRPQLSLKNDRLTGNKYIAGLKEVRLMSMEEAYLILDEGQKNRTVFSTILNKKSSRSHGIFTIKIVRTPIDGDCVIEDPACATVSRMAIVDLAGSERLKITNNTGQRLKEAGNINKSLMVLGQCMEILRSNQIREAAGKKPDLVPFQHCKLTQIFKTTFVGDGKAVMLVNINPFDTGFDENSHVMKFSAVAKDVMTLQQVPARVDHGQAFVQRPRTKKAVQCLPAADFGDEDEIMGDGDGEDEEEEEEVEVEDEDREDPFINDLLAKLQEAQEKWVEAETRCTMIEVNAHEQFSRIEADIREEVSKEFAEQLKVMEETYRNARERENNINEEKTERKIDLLTRRRDSVDSVASNSGYISELEEQNRGHLAHVIELEGLLEEERMSRKALADKVAELERDLSDERLCSDQLLHELTKRMEAADAAADTPIVSSEVKPEELEETPAAVMYEDVAFAEENHVTTLQHLESSTSPESASANALSSGDAAGPSSPPPPSGSPRDEYRKRVERFMALRRKMQRVLQDVEKNRTLFKEIEEFEGVDLEMLRETKMPKVFKLVMQQNFDIKEKAKQLTKSWADMERSAREPSPSGNAESVGHAVVIMEAQVVPIDESEDNVTQDPGVSDEVVQGLQGRGQNERSSAANQEYAGRVAGVKREDVAAEARVRNPLVAIAQERLGDRATANSKGTDGRMEDAENAVPVQQKAQKKETTWNSKKNRQGRKKGSSGGVKRAEQEEPEEEENTAKPKDGKKKKRKLYRPTMSDEAINEHSNTFSPVPKFRPFSN